MPRHGHPLPALPLTAHPATSISTWPSASLRHSTVTQREPCSDASAWLPQGTLPILGEGRLVASLGRPRGRRLARPRRRGHGRHHDDTLPSPVTGSWNMILDLSYHCRVGDLLRKFSGWNGAAAIWVTCQFSMLLAPVCRARGTALHRPCMSEA